MSRDKAPIELYADQMREIKRRTEVIDFFLYKDGHAMYEFTTVETVCLQFRKILELIAFSSLVANKQQYSIAHKNFESHWNAELLLKDLLRVNPDFYPKPVEEELSTVPGIKTHLLPIQEGFLTQGEFVRVYKKCGGMLHAFNPYGSRTGYPFFRKTFPEWRKKIIRLINCHQVHLVGQTNFWLFHMQEDGDDNVHYYDFGLVGDCG